MEKWRDLAIILRSVTYQERHKIVTLLTENYGMVSAIGNNAIQSRRFGGALDFLVASEVEYSKRPGQELGLLSEATVRRNFEKIRTDYTRLLAASLISELFLKLIPANAPSSELFRLLANALAELDESENDEIWVRVLISVLARTLHWTGHSPQLFACLACERSFEEVVQSDESRTHGVRVSVNPPGWYCQSCESSSQAGVRFIRLNSEQLATIQIGVSLSIRKAVKEMSLSEKSGREVLLYLLELMKFHVPGIDRGVIQSLRLLKLEES